MLFCLLTSQAECSAPVAKRDSASASSLAPLPLRCGSAEQANDPGHLSTCIGIPRESAGRIAHFESTVLRIPTAGLVSSTLECLGSSGHVISLSRICSCHGELLKISVARASCGWTWNLLTWLWGWALVSTCIYCCLSILFGGLPFCRLLPSTWVVNL